MEFFKFVSDRGTIEFSRISPYVFTSHENLNGAEVQMQEDKFIGTDGAEYRNMLFEPDELIIKGFIKAESKETIPVYRAKLFKFLNGKDSGKLYYTVGNKNYFTEVLTMRPEVGEAVQNILNFTVRFKRTAPLWKEARLNKCDLYMLKKNLKTEFAFPLVFSERTARCIVVNGGDVSADCVITIKGTAELSEEAASNEIKVTNHTTGEYMILNYSAIRNEEIKIDSNMCSVVSSEKGNIINKLRADSTFLKLAVGKNDIEVANSDTANEFLASIEFYNTVLGV